jgi:uncharacterized protein (TIGR03437 family)
MKIFIPLLIFTFIAGSVRAADPVSPAYFLVHDTDDGKDLTFVIQVTNPATIDQARGQLVLPQSERSHVTGTLVKAPSFYNAPWGYHLDPVSIGFFDTSVEVCDANPQYVQDHLADVGDALLPENRWCPWNSTLTAEIPAPANGANHLRAASAASNSEAAISPGSIISLWGAHLTDSTVSADGSPWPSSLGGVHVQLTAAGGYAGQALLLLSSPGQVNAWIPKNVPAGVISIILTNASGTSFQTAAYVESVGPALFTVNKDNTDYAAAVLIRVHADGTTSAQSLVGSDPATGQLVPVPADAGPESDKLYLSLYGTGFTGSTAQTVGSVSPGYPNDAFPVLYAGPQGQIDGLDQINIEISRELVSKPSLDILPLDILLVAKKTNGYPVRSNQVRILFGGAAKGAISTKSAILPAGIQSILTGTHSR